MMVLEYWNLVRKRCNDFVIWNQMFILEKSFNQIAHSTNQEVEAQSMWLDHSHTACW